MALITLGIYHPEDVLPYADKGAPPKVFRGIDGKKYTVGMGSQRYRLFQRSLSCCCCGLTGNFMLLQCTKNFESPHFNLYHINGDDCTLMTKDHILPHSRGGRDTLDNYQTMCEICNGLKGQNIAPLGTLLQARLIYNDELPVLGTRKAFNKARIWLEDTCKNTDMGEISSTITR